MSILITKESLTQDLQNACGSFPNAPVVVHSDLFQIGATCPPKNRLQIGSDYEEALNAALNDRPLVIPTFNYDFCKNGIYNISTDPCQVGALGDYFRQKYPHCRTHTPIFNFVIPNFSSFAKSTPKNVFGINSIFQQLHKANAIVMFLGADFPANTFIHYIEECQNIGYRYLKTFTGKMIGSSGSIPVVVEYRVRPLVPELIVYDWPKIKKEALQNNILKQSRVGHGHLLSYQTSDLFNDWSQKLSKDPFYLLTPASKENIQKLAQIKGYPFTFEMFEKGDIK